MPKLNALVAGSTGYIGIQLIKLLTKLKIYSGNDHPHSAQNPQVIELGKLNSKNLVRN